MGVCERHRRLPGGSVEPGADALSAASSLSLPQDGQVSGDSVSVRLEWDGKPTEVERLSLPFQTVETINQSRATRDRDSGSLLAGQGGDADHPPNQLIWGDNKLVMSSLLKDYAGKIDLIYIDPPFDTGTDFSFRLHVGDEELTKSPSILEESAYRDTWGAWRLVLFDDVVRTGGVAIRTAQLTMASCSYI